MSGLRAAACDQILGAVQGCCALTETQWVDLLLSRKHDTPLSAEIIQHSGLTPLFLVLLNKTMGLLHLGDSLHLTS